jgi:hypothetical protein
MKWSRVLTGSICFALAIGSFGFAQKVSVRKQNRQALVQMERDFARAAATKGTRDAFLEFIADDGILFQPGPINGKKFWTERQPRKGLLSWEPIFADVSRAGDLGYTTGPWEFRPNGPMTSRSRLASTSQSGKSRATARGNLCWIVVWAAKSHLPQNSSVSAE